MDDDFFDETITVTYLKRLHDNLEVPQIGSFGPWALDGVSWWFILVPVLLIGLFFVGWMYVKDSRSIRWYFAIILGMLRLTVYGLLTYMFLLPTEKKTQIRHPRTPPPTLKYSRVVVLIDVSESMSKHSDDLKPSEGATRKTRLQKVVETISDNNAAFMKKLLDTNPVYVYRFGTRLDNEVNSFLQEEEDDPGGIKKKVVYPFIKSRNAKNPLQEDTVKFAPWTKQDWDDFAHFTDFKSWIVKGLSENGRAKVLAVVGNEPGTSEWAEDYLAKSDAEAVEPLKLTEEDVRVLKGNRFNAKSRINLARSITQGTNVVESVRTAFDAEKDNMLEAIIVFSDGHSNIGVESRSGDGKEQRKSSSKFDELRRAAQKLNIPIITIGIGEEKTSKIKLVRVTDLQAPDQTPPDDAFKIFVELDGENMPGATKEVVLEITPENCDSPFELTGMVTFDQSEPPHAQFEWTINPADIADKIPEEFRSKVISGKELVEGKWKVRARMKKVEQDGKDNPKENVFSEVSTVDIAKKPIRVLLVCAAPNRDFQFLLNQLVRDKADLSVYVQNEAGTFQGEKSITFLDDKFRHLKEFPNRLVVEDDPTETPETRWLNLARYDVIIAFDPDWTLLTREQAERLQTWVDLQAGGLLHVAGPIHTKKLTYPDNAEKLEPLLSIFPVIPGDYDLKMANRERRDPRRLEFPGASPEMEFLRLDDDKPDTTLSGWEQFFTGKQTAEEGMRSTLRRGFYDYYPVKDVKAGATIVARYMEPQANENTFDRKDPPYIVTFKYGQGMTAFLGSSEIWRFNQYKGTYFQRFWVKMLRYLSSGSRKKQNRRGRILMAKDFTIADYLRGVVQLLGPDLKGLPASQQPEVTFRPVELESYAEMGNVKKKDAPQPKKNDADPDRITKEKEDYHKRLTRVYKMSGRAGSESDAGYFEFKKLLTGKEFPPGIWRVEVPIPNSSEMLSQKFQVRKALPPEMADVTPDYYSLALLATDVKDLKAKLTTKLKKPAVYDRLSERAFRAPGIDQPRMMYRITDKQSLDLIPECMEKIESPIENPQIEPEYRKDTIEPRWFGGIRLPRFLTSWYDDSQDFEVANWMLVCVALLSVEWFLRKLLKLA